MTYSPPHPIFVSQMRKLRSEKVRELLKVIVITNQNIPLGSWKQGLGAGGNHHHIVLKLFPTFKKKSIFQWLITTKKHEKYILES